MSENPFNVTKAVDFTDQQIQDTWVDLPMGSSFAELVEPSSQMPMLLVGGKGCGRTHLMRYFSYPLQKLRASSSNLINTIRSEGYIGVFFRCEGLNAGRFSAKGQSAEIWDAVFCYYMDLWLAQLTLSVIHDLLADHVNVTRLEAELCADTFALFDQQNFEMPTTLPDFVEAIRRFRREVDIEVNNVALTRKFGVVVRETRSRLIFGIPAAMQLRVPELAEVRVVYLIDELENLTAAQQKYVNTLIREKQPPVSFKVGARRHGLRTFETFSAGEENRAGSEYEPMPLDDLFRDSEGRYATFARKLVARRLEASGHRFASGASARDVESMNKEFEKELSACFDSVPDTPHDRAATKFVEANYDQHERPYLVTLRKKLGASLRKKAAPGVSTQGDIDKILNMIAVSQYPLIEKTNVYLLYKEWAAKRDLALAAHDISKSCRAYLEGDDNGEQHRTALKLFRTDLLAQILRECRQRQRYVGLDNFVAMSFGLPRNLMIVLKCIYKWSIFNGERPFQGSPISIQSQQDGALQAANWFFEDSRCVGDNAQRVQDGVERLANFFHRLRFSDKPVESSLVTFGFVESEVSTISRATILAAYESSLLIQLAGGHKSRNATRVQAKYQLNPMLAPRYDLPLGRRGVIELKSREVNAIFDHSHASDFDDMMRARLDRMTAPFGYGDSDDDGGAGGESPQELLPGVP